MATKVYGASDDLVEFEGDVYGEVGAAYEKETLVLFSDGTLLTAKYPKSDGLGVWGITILSKGSLFDRVDVCDNEDADPYSDVAHFKDGLKWAYAATEWERVK